MARGYWLWTIAASSALAICGSLNAAQASAPTPNLPNVQEVYKFDAGRSKPLPNNWIMGTVTGMSVANSAMGGGSAGSVDFSSDPAQRNIFIPDLVNGTVWELDRQSGEIIGHISHKGQNPGEFVSPHVSAMDSEGNVYVGELGRNPLVQKFVPAT